MRPVAAADLEGDWLIGDSLPRHVLGAVITALVCAAAWYLQLISLFASALIVLIPILLSFVGIYSGWYWAVAGALGCAVCAYFGGGAAFAGAAVLGLVLPVFVQYETYRRRTSFSGAVIINSLAFLLLGFCALMLLRLIYGDLGDMQAVLARKLWDAQTDFDILGGGLLRTMQGRNFIINLFISSGYMTGAENLLSQMQTAPTTELYTRCIDYAVYMIKYVTDYTIAGSLASSALLCGFLTTAWPRMIAVRRGVEPEAPFTPLRSLYLPGDLITFVCVAYIVSRLIVAFMPEWWYGIDYAIRQCAVLLMCVQGIATLERRLREGGMRRGLRGGVLIFTVLMFKTLVVLIGIVSALFGSHGVISSWINSHMSGDDE